MPNITLNYFKMLYEFTFSILFIYLSIFPFPILQMKISQIPTDAWLGKVIHYGGGGDLVMKSHPTLCDPRDCSPPGSSVHGGISQARILEWVATSFSRGSSWPRDRICISCLASEFFTTEPPGKPWPTLDHRAKNGKVKKHPVLRHVFSYVILCYFIPLHTCWLIDVLVKAELGSF